MGTVAARSLWSVMFPGLGRVFARGRARVAPDVRADPSERTAAALASAGARVYEIDAERIVRFVSLDSEGRGSPALDRDVRALVDPLGAVSHYPQVARAFRGRQPFRDLLVPISVGGRTRVVRVSGTPVSDADGAFRGYRGLVIDAPEAERPAAASRGIGDPELRRALVNALGTIVGYADFLQQDLPANGAHSVYAERIQIAAATAIDIVVSGEVRPFKSDDQPEAAHGKATPVGAMRARVLIVHDIPELADLVSIAFDRIGFETAVCRDEHEAIEILEEDPAIWDVLIATALHESTGAGAVVRHAKRLNPAMLCVVCAAPAEAALLQADVDLCWPRPMDAMALARMVEVQLADRRQRRQG
jgi:CheY-like chemotaxis protein